MRRFKTASFFGVFAIILSVIFVILFWFYNNGRLKIVMPAGEKIITIQNGENTEVITTNDEQYSKILSSKNYTISVRQEQESKSYISNHKVGRFLGESTFSTTLNSEDGRSFVGENPRSCSEFLASILVSFTCNGPFEGMIMHLPATESTPTYTKSIKSVLDLKKDEEIEPSDVGVIEGVVNNGNELLVLTYRFESGIGFHNLYRVEIINNSFALSFVKRIEQLPEKSVFKTKISKDSLMLYSEDFNDIYMGPSLDNLKRINLDIYNEERQDISHMDTHESMTVVGYREKNNDKNFISEKIQKSTVVVIGDKRVEKTYSFGFEKLQLCGNSICALDYNSKLHILSENLESLVTYANVLDFVVFEGNITFATKTETTTLKLSDLSGYTSVSFGSYSYGGLSISESGLVIVLNSGTKSHALTINTDNNNYPDKDVERLLNEKEDYINTVSIYSDHIFISPELGERQYIQETGKYGYPEETKATVKTKINNYLKEIELNQGAFKVKINNL